MLIRYNLNYSSYDEFIAILTSCKKCPRLVKFRVDVASQRSRYPSDEFWSKPVPGFGDIDGTLLILGLAPAATGGNRTGRVFTGDKSSDFLVDCLHEVGITNIPTSTSRDDGLRYENSFISAVLKCVPPGDKPLTTEIENCSDYLGYEINSMKNLKVILSLGGVAHAGLKRYLKKNGYEVGGKKFSHGAINDYGNFVEVCCYHPSPRNVNTGRLTRDGFIKVLKMARELSLKPPR